MDNTTQFIQHPTNFQFLSVCHYINSFGIFFYNENLIPFDHQNHSSAVLNTYFEYIQKWENPNEGKLKLLQRVLRGSDLYGGGKNETLDMKYVNETYQYIISNALFSHYGNIHGFLADIISRADNITYLALKETVYQHFSKYYVSRDFCSTRYESYQLTNLTLDTVFQENVWSLFPEPKNNTNILDVNYIYAMIGLKIARSVLDNDDVKNFTFENYILLSQAIEFQSVDNESHQLVLELFTTPALFHYAFNERVEFQKEHIMVQLKSAKFWKTVYRKFFYFLKNSLQETMKMEYENSLHYQLEKEMGLLESRTVIAIKILKEVCDYSNIGQVSELHVSLYKTSRWLLKFVLPEECQRIDLPDLEELYNSQFVKVGKLFNKIEQNSLEQILLTAELTQKMSLNTSVLLTRVPSSPMHCMYCAPWPRKTNDDIYLMFAVIENKEPDFYAIRQVNNSLTLLAHKGAEQEFGKSVANDSSLEMNVSPFAETLKYQNEDYRLFIQRVADIKTKQFLQGLVSFYKDPTVAEQTLDILKSLVPFYTCTENIRSGNKPVAAMTCSLDVLSLLPITGVAVKYSSKLWSNLLVDVGQHTFWSLPKVPIISIVNQIYRSAIQSVMAEIFTKGLLKDLFVASLRTVDPGFELTFQVTRFSNLLLRRMIHSLSSRLKNNPLVQNLLKSFRSAMDMFHGSRLVPDHTGLVPMVLDQGDNYQVVRYLYPGGRNYFGPRCISSFGKTAEFRTIEDEMFPVPVVPVKSKGSSIFYREYDPKNGKTGKEKLEIGGHDILRRMGMFLDQFAADGKDISVINNYHVYPGTVHWNKPSLKRNQNENLEQSVADATPRSPIDDDTPSTSELFTNADYIPEKHLQRTVNLMEKFKQQGLVGLKKENNLIPEFRRIVNSMDYYQNTKLTQGPIDLWLSETLTRPSIVQYLKNLEGGNFYFNDITLVTDISPVEISPKKIRRYSLKTEVRYHIHFDSQYGLLDLSAIHTPADNFKNEYLIFPETDFLVTGTEYLNGKEILIVNLKQKKIDKDEWLHIRMWNNLVIDTEEIVKTTRVESIERAALFVADNTPLFRRSKTERILKKYILRITDNDDATTSLVPTYDTFARDIYAENAIPEKYNKWKIMNNLYVDDVLFRKELHLVENLKTAKRTINYVFGGIYRQRIDTVFEIYHNSPEIRNYLRFEDYYVLYSFLNNNLLADINASKRVATSIGRLALRQCAEEFLIKTPITIYYAANLPRDVFEELIRYKTGSGVLFPHLQQFHSNRETVVNNCPIPGASETLVLYELKMTNRAGIADLSLIFDNTQVEYFVPQKETLTILKRYKEKINGKDVFVVTLDDDKLSTEERMIRLVNKLNVLMSGDVEFYFNF